MSNHTPPPRNFPLPRPNTKRRAGESQINPAHKRQSRQAMFPTCELAHEKHWKEVEDGRTKSPPLFGPNSGAALRTLPWRSDIKALATARSGRSCKTTSLNIASQCPEQTDSLSERHQFELGLGFTDPRVRKNYWASKPKTPVS